MKKAFLLFVSILSTTSLFSQFCNITFDNQYLTVCQGDSAIITATGFYAGGSSAGFDFNTGTLPPGWSVTGGTTFSAPCGPNPSGTPYYWASAASTGTPSITTSGMNVVNGGFVQFDLVYSVQGGAAPCEGPDQFNEGVQVQYSVSGGPWTDIIYYAPTGATLVSTPTATTPGVSGPTPMTTWATYNVPIPAGATSSSTAFRWIQFNSSGSCCDNWGMDNILIGSPGPYSINWSNGITNNPVFSDIVYSDTTYIAYLIDSLGNVACQDTIHLFAEGYTVSNTDSTCKNSLYSFGDGYTVQVIDSSITHTSSLTSVNGCDSLVTTTVFPQLIDLSMTVQDSIAVLSNPIGSYIYAWFECDSTGAPGNYITTSSSFTAPQYGNYLVIGSNGSCSDTSDCITLGFASIDELNNRIEIFPNPVDEVINIVLDKSYSNATYRVIDGTGRIAMQENITLSKIVSLDVSSLKTGVYTLEIDADQDHLQKRFTKK